MKPLQKGRLGYDEDERFQGAHVIIIEEYPPDAWIVYLEDPGNAPAYAMPEDRLVVRLKSRVYEVEP